MQNDGSWVRLAEPLNAVVAILAGIHVQYVQHRHVWELYPTVLLYEHTAKLAHWPDQTRPNRRGKVCRNDKMRNGKWVIARMFLDSSQS